MTGPDLKAVRKALRYTQTDLAKHLKINRTTLWYWETEKHPVPSRVEKDLDDLRALMMREIGKDVKP